ncbi:MAG: hypothetical protein JSV88_24535 [Candidatus Aminicenantes bacterium]|nr:MAG: hypothetical protein JSV88_24535 [Candidatus Aminicenantes bacterium]
MKKLLFIMLVIITALALLTLPGCKKANNITGTWFITTMLLGETFTDTYTFAGNKNSGEVLWQGQALGTYSVMGNNVSFTLEYLDADDDYTVEVYSGFFDHYDYMSGTFTYTVEGYPSASGTWFAER